VAAKKVGSVYTEIRARLDKYEKDLAKAQGITKKGATKIQKRINKISFRKASQSMANFSRIFNTAAIAMAGGGAIGSLIKISTDYEDTIFRMSQTFQGESDAMIAKAKSMAAQFKYYYDFNDISYAFTKTADSMERYGITGDKYIQLVARAADVGASKNLDLKESIDRIESAMRGEAEASEYLGITLNDTYLKNIAFNGALKDTWEKMTDLQKTQHRFNELMIQTAKYQGAAERAANTLSGAMSSLGKAMKDRLAPYLEVVNETIKKTILYFKGLWAVEQITSKRDVLKKYQEELVASYEETQKKIKAFTKMQAQFPDPEGKFEGARTEKLDKMFQRLGLLRRKLELVSGEIIAIEKKAADVFGGGAGSGGGRQGLDYSFLDKTDTAYRMSRAGGVVSQMGSIEEAYRRASELGQRLAEKSPLDSWQVKAEKSFKTVADVAKDSFDTVSQSVDAMANSMSDALANFVLTGKMSFKSFAESIIADIVRIQSKALITGLFSMIGGASGGGSASGPTGTTSLASAIWAPRAYGGPVSAGKPYVVGEKGPELFVPGNSGEIVPAAPGGAAGGATVNNYYYITAMDSQSVFEAVKRSGAVPAIAAENLSDNGMLRQAMIENL
jgi:hypothetical protein